MKSFFSFLIFFISLGQVAAQISVGAFLKSAEDARDVKMLREQVNFLHERSYRLSPLQRMEFRMQTRELDTDLQEYALRFSPANPWEVRRNNKYFSTLASTLELENQVMLKEALIERYYCVILYAFYSEMTALMQESQTLVNNQIRILEGQSGSSFFDADEYLDLQIDQLDTDVEFEEESVELIMMIGEAERLMGVPLPDSLGWRLSNLISVEKVRKVTDSLVTASVSDIIASYHQRKIDLANSEYKLERANMNLGFFQTEFDSRRVEQDRIPFNLSFGVTIPITNPNKGDMAKRRLDAIEAQNELEEARKEKRAGDEMQQQKLARLLFRYQDLSAKVVTLDDSELASALSSLKGGDPRVVLRFHQNRVKLKTMLAKLHRDILLTYVDYLAVSDHLQQRPMINFLSSQLEAVR